MSKVMSNLEQLRLANGELTRQLRECRLIKAELERQVEELTAKLHEKTGSNRRLARRAEMLERAMRDIGKGSEELRGYLVNLSDRISRATDFEQWMGEDA